MSAGHILRCVIIGEGTLPIRCGELLRDAGHELAGIISGDSRVLRWGEERGIRRQSPTAELAPWHHSEPFDFLFSIVNRHIIPQSVLDLPRRAAINYHDGPLPRYAGAHATSWALIHREPTHGITWHVMAARVDAGAILKQRIISISPTETAFTLNAKCYEQALDAFAELIEELAQGREIPRPQNLEERTYFSRWKRPPAAGLLAWHSTAEDLDALVRALDFGPYPNPLGLPKLLLGRQFLLATHLEVQDSQSRAPAGTILAVAEDGLVVATASRDVLVRGLQSLDGLPVAIEDLMARQGLVPGDCLPQLNSEEAQRLSERNTAFCRHEAFWVERLATLQPVVIPYADRSAASQESTEWAAVEASVPALTRLLAGGSVGGHEFLFAAFAAYLSRLGVGDCLDLGYRDAEWEREGLGREGVFAPFVPVRLNVDARGSVLDLAHRLAKELVEVRRCGSYARDVVARYPSLRSLRELGWDQRLSVSIAVGDQTSELLSCCGSDLVLLLESKAERCRWLFRHPVLTQATIKRMLASFQHFLDAAVTDTRCPIERLPLLTDGERDQLLVSWNNTQRRYTGEACIHRRFESQVERTPYARALVVEEEALTYQELNRRANRWAHYLRRLGVGPEVPVGVCAERSLEMVVGMLGVLKAGGAYVPLEPSYPRERLAQMLADARVPIVLTQRNFMEHMPRSDARLLLLEESSEVGRESVANLRSDVTGENLVYVIFTSGSTGRSKGVAVEHRQLANYVDGISERLALPQGAGYATAATFGADLGNTAIFPSLCGGGCLYLASPRLATDADAWAEYFRCHPVDCLKIVPSHLAALLASTRARDGLPRRCLVLGGEASHWELIQTVRRLAPDLRILNHYGPTETTVGVLTHEVTEAGTEEAGARSATVPLGRPLPNTRIYLLDRHGQLLPVGVPGELYVGGSGLARGYINRPELTAERFVPDPFSDDPAARLYKTGDWARYLPDGSIEFLGREDDQVKIRGFRIEMAEIEAALARHPTVREVTVVAREDRPGQKYLVAYIVPAPERAATPEVWRGFLRETLPDYMIPSAWMQLDALPLTANGKVDRRALPAPEWNRDEHRPGYVAPRDPWERQLAKIWEQVLGVPLIGVRDNFFDQGGNSLIAVALFARIRKTWGKHLPLAALFQAPTVEQLAGVLREGKLAAPWNSLVPIQSSGSRRPLFCVHTYSGNLLFYYDLARYLGPDQPTYGLQAPGLDGRPPRSMTVVELATRYLQEIRCLQPEGPYLLSGYCFGAIAAFEMARQLYEQGEQVGLVAVFDTYPNIYLPSSLSLRQRMRQHWMNVRTRNMSKRLVYCVGRLRALPQRIRDGLFRMAATTCLSHGRPLPSSLLEFYLREVLKEACYAYLRVPKPHPVRITCFQSAGSMGSKVGSHPEASWGSWATGGVEVHITPGDHMTLLQEPHVQVLAERLRRCIEEACEPRSGSSKAGGGHIEAEEPPIQTPIAGTNAR